MPWSFQFIIGRCKARGAITARTFVTASARFIQGSDSRWELFSTTLKRLFLSDSRWIRRPFFGRGFFFASIKNKTAISLQSQARSFYFLTEVFTYFDGR